jgi:hypothetical protein
MLKNIRGYSRAALMLALILPAFAFAADGDAPDVSAALRGNGVVLLIHGLATSPGRVSIDLDKATVVSATYSLEHDLWNCCANPRSMAATGGGHLSETQVDTMRELAVAMWTRGYAQTCRKSSPDAEQTLLIAHNGQVKSIGGLTDCDPQGRALVVSVMCAVYPQIGYCPKP